MSLHSFAGTVGSARRERAVMERLDCIIGRVLRAAEAKRRRQCFQVIENDGEARDTAAFTGPPGRSNPSCETNAREIDGEGRSAEQGAAPPRSATSPGGKEERRK